MSPRLRSLIDVARRGLRKPPRYIAQRIWYEIQARIEEYRAPLRARAMTPKMLLARTTHHSIDDWWNAIAARPFVTERMSDIAAVDRLCPGETARILSAADRAVNHVVNLLGSGDVTLGKPIDWHRDYKSGVSWRPDYCRNIEYADLDSPSDVKFPWELSRMQWLIPVGQAYVLSNDETYAAFVRDTLMSWIDANPYAYSVNWACTMDVALRLITWTWLFHAFRTSKAWSDESFRGKFLASLYQHGDFASRHLEKSDVNGNHYTADAAGLLFAGLFFAGDLDSKRWHDQGWSILTSEIVNQVFSDGVDFEASVPYHRLVQELFLLPALYRQRFGLDVPLSYVERLRAMARFTAAYSRLGGSVPLWGDADDARTLPFRQDPINDHRYLLAITGLAFDDQALIDGFSGPLSEILWLLGETAAASLPNRTQPSSAQSAAFRDGGFYILRTEVDHVFVDCGPLGLADRGGHGHNDLLSFEAVLAGAHLITDCGAYLYTSDYRERNNFRSTAYHNTPQVDGEEINRFIRPDYLWFLHNDADFGVVEWTTTPSEDSITMWHSGYRRLADPVIVHRRLSLDRQSHCLRIADHFEGTAAHQVEIPLHLAPDVSVSGDRDACVISKGNTRFAVTWQQPGEYDFVVEDARVSPSYGVVRPIKRLSWRRRGTLKPLTVDIRPIG